ncbi:hypothetical protein GCM10007870_24040 [Gluconobacter kondonii]|uniref:Uncharacterized protein n=1 Tax=Gluconobacter kondonii TaxID=941463 RepID=A0ABQ5WV13_9PROT|nr:hypothetical protein GCM10007870_24040 [Gluconobacter kondonii]
MEQHGPSRNCDRDGPDRRWQEWFENPDRANNNAAGQQGDQNGPGAVLRTILEKIWHLIAFGLKMKP